MSQAVFVFDIGGSECVTTLDVAVTGGTDYTNALALKDFMEAAWVPTMATQCVLREVRYLDAVATSGEPGGGETNALPATCALIVQKNTGTSVRGRMFLPGLAEADVDAGGRVGTELQGIVNDNFADALADLVASGIVPRVVSTTGAGAATDIIFFVARPFIAVLRNRLVGR